MSHSEDRNRRPTLILASASPRRQELLLKLGLPFRTLAVDVDESALAAGAGSPEEVVARLARRKAEAALERLSEGPGRLATTRHEGETASARLVIAADTVVAADINGDEGPVETAILGKPKDDTDAAAMLACLSGREHRVLTGVALALLDPEPGSGVRWAETVETTRVRMALLTREQIRWYVATGEPRDKAGAYAIQGRASVFVTGINGCYFNVVGLPLQRLYVLCTDLGVDLLRAIPG
jgi:septum formation protein